MRRRVRERPAGAEEWSSGRTIKIDGQPLASQPGHAVPIDPGTHQLQYTVGGETKLSSVTIVEGEKSRVIVLGANASAPPPAASPVSPAPPSAEPSSNGYLIAPIIVGGVGVLTLLASTGMVVVAKNEASQRDQQTAVFHDTSRSTVERSNAGLAANSHNDAANNDQLVALILGGSALALLGVAVTLYVVGRPSSKKAAQFSPVITF